LGIGNRITARILHARAAAHCTAVRDVLLNRALRLMKVKVYQLSGEVIIQDNTFRTSKENRPFFAAVVVDGENK
jgi:hypothetical protein